MRSGWLKPDKVQMELLGSVMRFPESMFGLGDYRLRLRPGLRSHARRRAWGSYTRAGTLAKR